MKKIYSLMFTGLISLGVLVGASTQVSAQALNNAKGKSINVNVKGIGKGLGKTLGTIPNIHNSSSAAVTESFWLNDALANDSVYSFNNGQSVAVPSAYPLFPDTDGLFQFSNGYFPTFVHLAGNVLDPYAANMQFWSGESWNQYTDYTVDSMAVEFVYDRNANYTGTDTMLVYLYNDSNGVNLGTEWFVGPGVGDFELSFQPPGNGWDTTMDTLYFKEIFYDTLTNSPLVTSADSAKMLRLKIPLTIADTGVVVKSFYTGNYHIPANKHAVSAVGYKPGFAYVNGDTISNNSEFRIISYEENGAGTNPYYFGTGSLYLGTGIRDWNISEIANDQIRYNQLPGWNGSLLPPYLFTEAYTFEEWDIFYYVTASYNVAVKETKAASGLTLYQNQPNPANSSTTDVKYETTSNGAVSLEVRDLTGRVVKVLNQGTQSAGIHNISVDVTSLAKGMYTYTLTTNTESLTRRMVISK